MFLSYLNLAESSGLFLDNPKLDELHLDDFIWDLIWQEFYMAGIRYRQSSVKTTS